MPGDQIIQAIVKHPTSQWYYFVSSTSHNILSSSLKWCHFWCLSFAELPAAAGSHPLIYQISRSLEMPQDHGKFVYSGSPILIFCSIIGIRSDRLKAFIGKVSELGCLCECNHRPRMYWSGYQLFCEIDKITPCGPGTTLFAHPSSCKSLKNACFVLVADGNDATDQGESWDPVPGVHSVSTCPTSCAMGARYDHTLPLCGEMWELIWLDSSTHV